jgi:Uma2 family endonuclease
MTTLTATEGIPTITTEFPNWQPATWEDYLSYRDNSNPDRVRLFFDGEKLFIEEGAEGVNHAKVSDLFTMLFCFWFDFFQKQTAESLGRCLLEKANKLAATPDLILYKGEMLARSLPPNATRIDFNNSPIPHLVGEISDTTLATDLDEKKQLYADLEIPEYWVVDVVGKRVLGFRLQQDKTYQQVAQSVALEGLPISLLGQALQRLSQGTNISAASWFAGAIANLP